MQLNTIMYIDLADPLPKSYAPKKGEEMNRSTYSTMCYMGQPRLFRKPHFLAFDFIVFKSDKRTTCIIDLRIPAKSS